MKDLRFLNKYFFQYRRLLIWGILFVAASNYFRVLQPQVIRDALGLVVENVHLYRQFEGAALQSAFFKELGGVLLFFGALVLLAAVAPVSGLEGGLPDGFCNDGIDNDGDTSIDCDDFFDCLFETCEDGISCTAGETCRFAGCSGGTADDALCDDGVFCNGDDTCSDGGCTAHAGNPCDGADGDADCK